MLRNTLAVFALLVTAASSHAAIILTQSAPTPLTGGLVGITVSAEGTAGETINTITGPVINAAVGGLGVHNVAQAFTGSFTPTTAQHTVGLWNAAWTPYDTYFMYNAAETLSAGSEFTETNGGQTTGTLGLPVVPGAPTSGFGTYSASATSAKVILAPNADSNVPFLYVVLREADAGLLSVRVDGAAVGGAGVFENFLDYQIGGAVIPEPATLAMIGLALAGCFGFIRRR